jgi:DNA invertase Pin-like site-specific DNA recombinase
MTDLPTRCALYARISRPDEPEILDNPERDLRELAVQHGYVVIREYVEIASGADDGRAQLSALLQVATLLRRPWDVRLFRSLARLTRTGTYGALDLLRQLPASGAGGRILESPALDSAKDTPPLVRNVLLALLAELCRDYRERISRATREAYPRKKNLADGGKVVGGRPRKRVPPAPAGAADPPDEIGAVSGGRVLP